MIRKLSIVITCLLLSLIAIKSEAAGADRRLVEAAKTRDMEAVRSLLKQAVDVNAPATDGSTAIAWAVYWDDSEIAGLLLRAGANPDKANDYGVTPLTLACNKASAEMVERLLKYKANANTAQWSGETPLMTCAKTGNVDAVKALLLHGAQVNVRENRRGQTALMWAAAERHSDVVKLLIEHGAEVNARSHRLGGFKPPQFLTYGVYRRSQGVDRFETGDVHEDPDSSKGGFTPLMFASQQGDIQSALLILNAGANINDATPDYGNALTVASANSQEKLAVVLLEHGADPNVVDGWGFAPLHYALQEGITAIGMSRFRIPTDSYWLRSNMPELVRSLLAHGANPNLRVSKGFPPFDHAAFARTTGNSMPQIRQPGLTPFFLAAASCDATLMRLLVEKGANPMLTTDEGTTPLMVAAGIGKLDPISKAEEAKALEAVKLAVELGNDVNAENGDGRMALHGAAFLGADSVVDYLAAKGANVNGKDRYGQTALSIARGLSARANGGDKRFATAEPHKSTEALLIKLGATPLSSESANRLTPKQ